MDDAVLDRNGRVFDHLVGVVDDEVGVEIGLGLCLLGRHDGQTRRFPGDLDVRSGDLSTVLRRADAHRAGVFGDGKRDGRPIESLHRDVTRVGDDQRDGMLARREIAQHRRVGGRVQHAALLRNRRPLDDLVGAVDDEVGVVVGFVLRLRGGDDGQARRLPGDGHVPPDNLIT